MYTVIRATLLVIITQSDVIKRKREFFEAPQRFENSSVSSRMEKCKYEFNRTTRLIDN